MKRKFINPLTEIKKLGDVVFYNGEYIINFPNDTVVVVARCENSYLVKTNIYKGAVLCCHYSTFSLIFAFMDVIGIYKGEVNPETGKYDPNYSVTETEY